MILFPRTLAVLEKLVKDVKSALYFTKILVYSIFFIFYGYSIYSNFSNLPFLIIYSILLVLSIVGFIYLIIGHNYKELNLNKHKRFIRILFIFGKTATIVVTLIEIINNGITDFGKMLFIVSIISLFTQIIFELITLFVEKYIELITISISKDCAFIKPIKEATSSIYGLIDMPLQFVANKIDKKEEILSKKEQLIEELGEDYQARKKIEKDKEKIEKIDLQKSEIVSHFETIKNAFKRKTKGK